MGGVRKWTNESVITIGKGYAHCIANQIILANSSAPSILSNQLDLEYFHIYTFYFLIWSSEMFCIILQKLYIFTYCIIQGS